MTDLPSQQGWHIFLALVNFWLIKLCFIRNQPMKNQYHHKIDVCLMPGPVSINEEFSELVHWGYKFPMLYWTSQTNTSDNFRG